MTFTPEEITGMAEEAGMHPNADPAAINALGRSVPLAWIESLCALVAEKAAGKEREACATLVELGPQPITGFGSRVEIGFGARSAYAAAIRARGEKEGA